MKSVNKWTELALALLLGFWQNIQISQAEAIPSSCLEERLLDLVIKWKEGDELPFALPTLEEISIQSYEGQYSGYGVKIAFTTEDMRLVGVNNFTVEELIAFGNDTLEVSGRIQFPLLTLSTDNYALKGRAYVFYSLNGSGSMIITFRNVTVTFGMRLVPHGAGTQISDGRLDFSVEDAKIDLEDSSWPINKILNAEALRIINSYHTLIVDSASRGATNAINRYLTTLTPEKITNIIVGSCSDIK